MIKISLLSVANLANSSLFTANCALIRKILSHFSFATELCWGLLWWIQPWWRINW